MAYYEWPVFVTELFLPQSHVIISSSIESEECSDKAQIISDDICAGGKSQVTNDQASDNECTTL